VTGTMMRAALTVGGHPESGSSTDEATDPATGSVVGEATVADEAAVDAAVRSRRGRVRAVGHAARHRRGRAPRVDRRLDPAAARRPGHDAHARAGEAAERGGKRSRGRGQGVRLLHGRGPARGADILTGGERADGDLLDKGLSYQPTVIVVDAELRMAREETFGPVAPVIVVDDADEAVARANALDAGLVAYLYTDALLSPIGGSGQVIGECSPGSASRPAFDQARRWSPAAGKCCASCSPRG